MSKASTDNLKALGFVIGQFNVADADFDAFLQAVLDEVSVEVLATIGATAYADSTDPVKTRVINAEKYLAAALLEKRVMASISRTLSTVENRTEGLLEKDERDDFRAMAARNIALITGGVNESFAAPIYEPDVVVG